MVSQPCAKSSEWTDYLSTKVKETFTFRLYSVTKTFGRLFNSSKLSQYLFFLKYFVILFTLLIYQLSLYTWLIYELRWRTGLVLISAYKNIMYVSSMLFFNNVIFSMKGFTSAEKMVLSLSHSADTTLFFTAQLGQRLAHITDQVLLTLIESSTRSSRQQE